MSKPDWRSKPTVQTNMDSDTDVVIAIDESGNANLKPVFKALRKGLPVSHGERYFTLSAAVLKRNQILQAHNLIKDLKLKYWPGGLFPYRDRQKGVCFHSGEIRRHTGPFSERVIDHDAFVSDLNDTMRLMPMTLYAVHIDKEKLVQQYSDPINPYELGMVFILERIMMDLSSSSICTILLESRGKKEDRDLHHFMTQMLSGRFGTHLGERERNQIAGVYFNPKWHTELKEQTSYWTLELADLCGYPIHRLLSRDQRQGFRHH